MRYLRLPISVFLLTLFAASALGTVNYKTGWYWKWEKPVAMDRQYYREYLTSNNGAHAVAMARYGSPASVWVDIVTADPWTDSSRAFAHEYLYRDSSLDFQDTTVISDDGDFSKVCVSAAADGWEGTKVAVFCEADEDLHMPMYAGRNRDASHIS